MDEKKKCDCGCEHEECDCGCDDIVELFDDNGNPLKFYHIGTIEFKKAYYAAFQPAEEIEGLEEDEIVIYEVNGINDDESELLPIEDQDLLDEVYEEFCKVMEEDEDEDCDCEGDCHCHKHE